MPGLYIHIPFCLQKCPYCDFFSCDDRMYLADDYLECLMRELRVFIDKYDPLFETLFIGGGTPASLTEKQLDFLFSGIYALVPKKKLKEITIEANPETLTEKKAKVLAADTTRLSMGAQSLNDKILKILGRIHDAKTVSKAVSIAREQGMSNINIDLMYGIPGQSVKEALQDIKSAAGSGIEHISFYMLTVYEGTPFYARHDGGRGMPKDKEIEEMYVEGIKSLEAAGFLQYEISNFAGPGKECLHNKNYWDSGEYAGLGASASSFFSGSRYTNVKSIEEYIKRMKKNGEPAEFTEKITPEISLKEHIMLKLRTKTGINLREFRDKFGFDFAAKYSNIIGKFKEQGLMLADDSGARLTVRGFLLSNMVIREFF
jgi:oxygen-independent coproporphyrinogen-3 oxidase